MTLLIDTPHSRTPPLHPPPPRISPTPRPPLALYYPPIFGAGISLTTHIRARYTTTHPYSGQVHHYPPIFGPGTSLTTHIRARYTTTHPYLEVVYLRPPISGHWAALATHIWGCQTQNTHIRGDHKKNHQYPYLFL